MEERWMSEEMAVDRKLIPRFLGLSYWAVKYGTHAVDTEMHLIKLPSTKFAPQTETGAQT